MPFWDNLKARTVGSGLLTPVVIANLDTVPIPVNVVAGGGGGGGGGGGAATIASGADVVEGATADAAIITDTTGTVNGKLRGLVKIFADIWNATTHALGIEGKGTAGTPAGGVLTVQGVTSGQAIPVSLASAPSTPVTGTFYPTTQPVSIASAQVASGALATGAIVDLGTTITDAAATNVVEDTTAKTGIGLWKGVKNLLKLINDKLVTGTIIGDVNVRAITAGETHLGEIGGNTNTVSVEFTRESNATPYAAGDVISSSAGSPVLQEIPNAVRINGGSAYVTGLAVIFNVKSVTPRIRVHFFNASPSAGNIAGDNLPLIEKYADASKRLRYVELPAMITAADATNSDMSRSFITPPPSLPVQAAAGSRSIFVLLETLDAVTLTSGSKVTVVATFDNN